MNTETAEDTTGIDIESASDQIGAELFPATEPAPDAALVAETVQSNGEEASREDAPDVAQATTSDPTVKPAPKSWPKDMHDHWGKVPPEVQTYWETREKQMLDGLDQYKTDAALAKQFRDSLTPYRHTLQQLGVDELTAAKSLFQADHLLRYSPPDQKRAYFEQLAKNYGIDLAKASEPAAPLDPVVQGLRQELTAIQQHMTARQHAELSTARASVMKEVDAFASDPKHDLFNDCYEDIVKFITAGDSLQEAYDKAVWANPVTREKQVLSRLQTETEKAKERARLDALPKTEAKSVNMRGRDTMRAPTEPLGSMEDTMKSTLVSIRNKTIH